MPGVTQDLRLGPLGENIGLEERSGRAHGRLNKKRPIQVHVVSVMETSNGSKQRSYRILFVSEKKPHYTAGEWV